MFSQLLVSSLFMCLMRYCHNVQPNAIRWQELSAQDHRVSRGRGLVKESFRQVYQDSDIYAKHCRLYTLILSWVREGGGSGEGGGGEGPKGGGGEGVSHERSTHAHSLDDSCYGGT
jgi:hypothetical protein